MEQEKRKIYNKNYYENNKERLLEKFWCEDCGGFFTIHNKSKHYKTGKHIESQKSRVDWGNS